jgi:hypothetical protein
MDAPLVLRERVPCAWCALCPFPRPPLQFLGTNRSQPHRALAPASSAVTSYDIIILKVYGTSAELFTTEGFSQSDRPVQSRPTPKNQAERRRTFNLDHQLEGLHWLLTRRVKYIATNPR